MFPDQTPAGRATAAAAEAAEITKDRNTGLDEAKSTLIDTLAKLGIVRLEAEVSLVDTKPVLGAVSAYTDGNDIRDLAETTPIDFGWGEDHQSYDNLLGFTRDYLSAVLLHQRVKQLAAGILFVWVANRHVVQPIDYAAQDAERMAAKLAQLKADKADIVALLKGLGVVLVEAEYDGEADSGQVNDISARKADNTPVDLATTGPVSIGSDGQDTRTFNSLHELIDEFAWEVLSQYHGGFENNDGGFGNIVIDVGEGQVRIEHNWRISSSEYTEAAFSAGTLFCMAIYVHVRQRFVMLPVEAPRRLPDPDRGPEQHVAVRVDMILSLPVAWDDDDISTYVRGALGGTFTDDLPGEIDGQSPVNIDFQAEAEVHALERRPSRRRKRGGR